MIDNLNKIRMKLIKNPLIIVFLLSAAYVLAFSVNPFQQRLSAIGLSCVIFQYKEDISYFK